MRYFFLYLTILSLTVPAYAQDMESETLGLAAAIHRVKTGESGNVRWFECGRHLSASEATQRSLEYAKLLMEEKTRNESFDPWVAIAIAMQESSLNRCAISRNEWRAFSSSFSARYGRDPVESDLARLLDNSSWRSSLGVSAFDAGLVQYRWPGRAAVSAGVTRASSLLEARVSIRLLAHSLQSYQAACSSISSYRGVHSVNRNDGSVRVVRYDVPCMDGYWVQHNSPSWFNYRYYRNVSTWMTRFKEASLAPSLPSNTEESES